MMWLGPLPGETRRRKDGGQSAALTFEAGTKIQCLQASVRLFYRTCDSCDSSYVFPGYKLRQRVAHGRFTGKYSWVKHQ